MTFATSEISHAPYQLFMIASQFEETYTAVS